MDVPQAALCELIVSIRQREKRDLKQYVLSQLARSLAPPGATSERNRFRYATLGIALCYEVFRFVHEVNDLFVEVCRSSPDHGSKKNLKIVLYHLILVQTLSYFWRHMQEFMTYLNLFLLVETTPATS